MKGSKTKQPGRVSFSVQMAPDLKRRLADAAQREGITKNAWVVKAIEARLSVGDRSVQAREGGESHEFLHEEKLNDIRALRETW